MGRSPLVRIGPLPQRVRRGLTRPDLGVTRLRPLVRWTAGHSYRYDVEGTPSSRDNQREVSVHLSILQTETRVGLAHTVQSSPRSRRRHVMLEAVPVATARCQSCLERAHECRSAAGAGGPASHAQRALQCRTDRRAVRWPANLRARAAVVLLTSALRAGRALRTVRRSAPIS